MEISASWVEALSGIALLGVTVAGALLHGAFATRDARLSGLAETAKNLYIKHDEDVARLNDYKLHVAETYVNLPALEKIFAPLNRRLESIESELRVKHDRAS